MVGMRISSAIRYPGLPVSWALCACIYLSACISSSQPSWAKVDINTPISWTRSWGSETLCNVAELGFEPGLSALKASALNGPVTPFG